MDDATTDVRRVRRPGGIEVPYRVLGEGTRRMLYAHALTGSGLLTGPESFAPFLQEGWSVAVLDQRGHRAATPSTDPDDYAVGALAGDLVAVLDDLGWPSAWLCGASMGAAPSICAAVSAPERVDGLLLLAPAFGGERNAAADLFARVADRIATGGIEAGCDAWRTEMRARDVAEPALAQHLAQLRLHDPAAMAVWLREIGGWTIGEEILRLGRTDVPVAALAWEDDDIHPAALARQISAAATAGACEIVSLDVPDAGPDFLFRAGIELIRRVSGPDGGATGTATSG